MTFDKKFNSVKDLNFPKRDVMHSLKVGVNDTFNSCFYLYDDIRCKVLLNEGRVPDNEDFASLVRLFWLSVAEFNSAFDALYSFRSLYGQHNVLSRNEEQKQKLKDFVGFVNGLYV